MLWWGGQVPATKGSPLWSPAVHPQVGVEPHLCSLLLLGDSPRLGTVGYLKPGGPLCLRGVDLFILGFSEAGRHAALQPRDGGADHDHRVSEPAAPPSGPAPAGDPHGLFSIPRPLALRWDFSQKRPLWLCVLHVLSSKSVLVWFGLVEEGQKSSSFGGFFCF